MKKILVIAPHADDEVIGVGGTIAKHVDNGDEVHVCIAAFRADNSSDEQITQANTVKEILRYHDIYFLHLQDEYLDRLSRDIIKPLECIYKNIDPDIVYTCNRHDTNQDHRAMHDATMTVCRYHDNPPQKLIAYNSGSAIDFIPNYYNVISKDQVTRKLQSLACYEDQVHSHPHPRCPSSVESIMKSNGIQARASYAEPFMLIREVNL